MVKWSLYAAGVLIIGIAATALLTSHQSIPQESKVPVNKTLTQATSEFGFRLLKQLAEEGKEKNVFISPASASIALCMTYNGAAGETKRAMSRVLTLNGLSLEEVNNGCKNILENMRAPGKGVTVHLANSLWARKGIEFKPNFFDANRRYYQAEVSVLDFANPKAPKTINNWVNACTQGRIRDIVERIEPNTILFLVNAVYFKGAWQDKFDPKDTHPAEFSLPGGFTKTVRMMYRHGRVKYLPGDGFSAVSLPYGDGRFCMYIFLPNKDSSLSEFCKKLNVQNWNKWMQGFHSVECDLSIPKFTIEYESELRKALSALGMTIAFDPNRADFSNMCPIPPLPNVYIKSVLHKTFVEVNEEGTEAAGATKVEMGLTSAAPSISFTVDRPFFCAISDSFTGVVLFAGLIYEPM
ncbi:MAG: serpin family protein [Armatimonadota bacterium]|nr:serpin family protein [Armatimonadota bacterium]